MTNVKFHMLETDVNTDCQNCPFTVWTVIALKHDPCMGFSVAITIVADVCRLEVSLQWAVTLTDRYEHTINRIE